MNYKIKAAERGIERVFVFRTVTVNPVGSVAQCVGVFQMEDSSFVKVAIM